MSEIDTSVRQRCEAYCNNHLADNNVPPRVRPPPGVSTAAEGGYLRAACEWHGVVAGCMPRWNGCKWHAPPLLFRWDVRRVVRGIAITSPSLLALQRTGVLQSWIHDAPLYLRYILDSEPCLENVLYWKYQFTDFFFKKKSVRGLWNVGIRSSKRLALGSCVTTMHGRTRRAQDRTTRQVGVGCLCSSLRASSSFYTPAFMSVSFLPQVGVGARQCRWNGRAPSTFPSAQPNRSRASPPSSGTAAGTRTAVARLRQHGNTVARCLFSRFSSGRSMRSGEQAWHDDESSAVGVAAAHGSGSVTNAVRASQCLCVHCYVAPGMVVLRGMVWDPTCWLQPKKKNILVRKRWPTINVSWFGVNHRKSSSLIRKNLFLNAKGTTHENLWLLDELLSDINLLIKITKLVRSSCTNREWLELHDSNLQRFRDWNALTNARHNERLLINWWACSNRLNLFLKDSISIKRKELWSWISAFVAVYLCPRK